VTNKQLLSNPEQIARMGWTCHAQYLYSRQAIRYGLLKAKAMSVYATAPCTPILGPLAFKIIQLTLKQIPLTHTVYMKWKINFEQNFIFKQIRLESRLLYAEKYGISLAQQLHCEEIISGANTLEEIELPYMFLGNYNSSYQF